MPPQAGTYEQAVSAYLSEALAEQDYGSFLEAVGHIARGHGIGAIADSSGLGRESLYKALGPEAKPRFETVCRVMEALGLRLVVRPAVTSTK
jgi:probable addiction module antidote protein